MTWDTDDARGDTRDLAYWHPNYPCTAPCHQTRHRHHFGSSGSLQSESIDNRKHWFIVVHRLQLMLNCRLFCIAWLVVLRTGAESTVKPFFLRMSFIFPRLLPVWSRSFCLNMVLHRLQLRLYIRLEKIHGFYLDKSYYDCHGHTWPSLDGSILNQLLPSQGPATTNRDINYLFVILLSRY